MCFFLSGVCCYVNVAVKIFTSSFYLDILAYKQIGKLSKVNGHVSNSTHESKWFSKLIETDVTLSACFASLSLRLCVWVSSQFSRSAAAAAALCISVFCVACCFHFISIEEFVCRGELLTNNYFCLFSCMFVNKLNNKTSVNKFSFVSFA